MTWQMKEELVLNINHTLIEDGVNLANSVKFIHDSERCMVRVGGHA